MIEGKLKVFALGAEWFYQEMDKQDMELYKIDWAPPVELPDDISNILKSLKKSSKKSEMTR
jgi:hypothetical protein